MSNNTAECPKCGHEVEAYQENFIYMTPSSLIGTDEEPTEIRKKLYHCTCDYKFSRVGDRMRIGDKIDETTNKDRWV